MPRPRARPRRSSSRPRTPAAAVLVEPEPEMGARVPGVAMALEPPDGGLRLKRPCGVERMVERPRQDHPLVAHPVTRVHRHEPVDRARQRLQPVHVVGHRDGSPWRVAAGLVTFHDDQAACRRGMTRVSVCSTTWFRCSRTAEGGRFGRIGVDEERLVTSAWVAITAASNGSRAPWSVRTVTRVRAGGPPSRIARADGAGPERRDEPVHIRPRATGDGPPERSTTPIRPWLSRKRRR